MEQKKYTCTQPTLVIENPSPALVKLVRTLRDRKIANQEEMRRNWHVYFPHSKRK